MGHVLIGGYRQKEKGYGINCVQLGQTKLRRYALAFSKTFYFFTILSPNLITFTNILKLRMK